MKKITIVILNIAIIAILFILTGCTSNETNTINQTQNNISKEQQDYVENQEALIVQNEECEHDWVITSEYDWIFSQYRTVSKCSKCGKVIK